MNKKHAISRGETPNSLVNITPGDWCVYANPTEANKNGCQARCYFVFMRLHLGQQNMTMQMQYFTAMKTHMHIDKQFE